MSYLLNCDMCGKPVQDIQKFATLHPDFAVPGQVEHGCKACMTRLDHKLNTIREAHNKEIAQSMRDYVLSLRDKLQGAPD